MITHETTKNIQKIIIAQRSVYDDKNLFKGHDDKHESDKKGEHRYLRKVRI